MPTSDYNVLEEMDQAAQAAAGNPSPEPITPPVEPATPAADPLNQGTITDPGTPAEPASPNEPAVEPQEPVEPSGVKVFGAPAEPAKPAEPAAEIDDTIVQDYFKQKGVDMDLNTLIERAKQPTQNFATDDVRRMNDWLAKTGGTINDFLLVESLDLEKLSDVEAIEKNLSLTDPYIQQNPNSLAFELKKYDVKSIESEIEKKTKQLESADEESDKNVLHNEIAKLEAQKLEKEELVRRDGWKAKSALERYKADIEKPTVKPQASPEVIQEHNAKLNSYKEYKAINIPVGDKNVSLEFSPQEHEVINNILSTYPPLDSQEKYDNAYRFVSKSVLFDSAVSKAIEEGRALGQLGILKSEKNGSATPSSGAQINPAADAALKSDLDALSSLGM